MKALSFIALLFTLWSAGLLAAAKPFSEGVKAHGEKNYTIAAQKFTQAIAQEPNNSAAYFNLGLAEMGNKRFGAATWAFEKVLKFDPNDSEALERLERCQEALDPGRSYQPVLSGFEATLFGISSNSWALLAILSSLTFGLCLVLFKLKKHPSLRRMFLIIGFFSLVSLVFCTYTSASSASYFQSERYGIVVQPSIATYIDAENADKKELKEGTRLLRVEEKDGLLIQVEDPTGRLYLVKSSDLRFF
jgi:tetratricopeptide (TPR) repeat protein